MIDFSKLNLNETLEAEASSSEKATMSADKKKDTAHTLRQKNQMAQKTGSTQKSDVVYASEEYFSELAKQSRLTRAHEAAKVSWRQELEEHRGEPAKKDDEGNHPYISIMPHKNSTEKQAKKKMDQINQEKEMTVGESVSFCEAFDNLVEKEMSIADQMRISREAAKKRNPNPDHRAIRGKMLAKNKPEKDTRTDAEKMTDATGPRPGSRYRGD